MSSSGTPRAISHAVSMVAPNGREQNATLVVNARGVMLSTPGGPTGEAIPFAAMFKWVPANLRKANPGDPDCLDLQICTDAGPRELRLRFATGRRGVVDVMQQMEGEAARATQSSTGASDSGDIPVPPSPMPPTATAAVHRVSREVLELSGDMVHDAISASGGGAPPPSHVPLSPIASKDGERGATAQATPLINVPTQRGRAQTSPRELVDAFGCSFDDSELDYAGVQPRGQRSISRAQSAGGAIMVTPGRVTVELRLAEGSGQLELALQVAPEAPPPERLPARRPDAQARVLLGRAVEALQTERASTCIMRVALAGVLAQHAQLRKEHAAQAAELEQARFQIECERAALQSSRGLYDELHARYAEQARCGEATLQVLSDLQEDNATAARAMQQTREECKVLERLCEEARAQAASAQEPLFALRTAAAEDAARATVAAAAVRAMVCALAAHADELAANGAHAAARADAAEAALAQLAAIHDGVMTTATVERTVANALVGALSRQMEYAHREGSVARAGLRAQKAQTLAALEGQADLQVDLAIRIGQYELAASELEVVQTLRADLAIACARLDATTLREQALVVALEGAQSEAAAARKRERSMVSVALGSQNAAEAELAVLQERLSRVREAARAASDAEYEGRLAEAMAAVAEAQQKAADAEAQVGLPELRAQVQELTQLLEVQESELHDARAQLQEEEERRRMGAPCKKNAGVQTTPLEAAAAVAAAFERRAAEVAAAAAEKARMAVGGQQEYKAENSPRLPTHDATQAAVEWYAQETDRLKAEVRDLKARLTLAKEELATRDAELKVLCPKVGRVESEHATERAQAEKLRTLHAQQLSSLSARLESTLTAANASMAEADALVRGKDAKVATWKARAEQATAQVDAARKEAADASHAAAAARAQAAAAADVAARLREANAQLSAQLADTQGVAMEMHAMLHDGGTKMAELEASLMVAQRKEREWEAEVTYMQRLARQRSLNPQGSPRPGTTGLGAAGKAASPGARPIAAVYALGSECAE